MKINATVGVAIAAFAAGRLAAESKVRRSQKLAMTDQLTGLPNRAALIVRFHEVAHRPHTVLLVDLDGFKPINDQLGHRAGDRVLQEIGERLRKLPGAWAARLGGDEFVIILDAETDPDQFAERLLFAISAPMEIAGHGQLVSVRASAGISAPAYTGQSWRAVLHAADAAMYRAKEGRLGVAWGSAAECVVDAPPERQRDKRHW